MQLQLLQMPCANGLSAYSILRIHQRAAHVLNLENSGPRYCCIRSTNNTNEMPQTQPRNIVVELVQDFRLLGLSIQAYRSCRVFTAFPSCSSTVTKSLASTSKG